MVVGKHLSFISICFWNVGGLVSKTYNKLSDDNFIRELLPYDLVCLSETHIGYDAVYIEDFQYIPICRSMSKNNRYYRGLAILIRNSIRKGLKILLNTSSEFQWLKLSKEFFHLDSDVFICFSYITTCTFLQQSNEDTLDAIVRDINIYRSKGNILLLGDLNARTGIELDFIHKDDDKHIPLDIIDSELNQRESEDI